VLPPVGIAVLLLQLLFHLGQLMLQILDLGLVGLGIEPLLQLLLLTTILPLLLLTAMLRLLLLPMVKHLT